MMPFALSVLTALLLAATQAPASITPAALICLTPLIALAESDTPRRRRYGAAYLGGAAFFVLGCHWVARSDPANLVMMTVAEAAAFPAFLVLLRGLNGLRAIPLALRVALAWTAVEYARAHYPFNGFPCLLLGYAGDRPRALAQSADLIGVWGLSFVFAACNGLLYAAWRAQTRRWVGPSIVAALLVGLFGYGVVRLESVRGTERPGPVVGLVQGNIPTELKHGPSPERIYEPYARLTRSLAAENPPVDLLVWPETMYPGYLNRWTDARRQDPRLLELERKYLDPLFADVLRPNDTWSLIGALALSPGAGPRDIEVYNAAILFDPSGARRAGYDKSIRVPGGEFIPLEWLVPDFVIRLIIDFAGYKPGLVPGRGASVVEAQGRDGPYRFSPTICYENLYPGYNAAGVRAGADFTVNLSNEGWFDNSIEFDQMDVASRFRAIETRRSLVRATNTGITAVYDATGERRAVLLGPRGEDREVEGVLVARVPIYSSGSLYVRGGDAATILISLSALLLALAGWKRRYLGAHPT